MSSTNPFDQTRIRDDVVRYEYADWIARTNKEEQ